MVVPNESFPDGSAAQQDSILVRKGGLLTTKPSAFSREPKINLKKPSIVGLDLTAVVQVDGSQSADSTDDSDPPRTPDPHGKPTLSLPRSATTRASARRETTTPRSPLASVTNGRAVHNSTNGTTAHHPQTADANEDAENSWNAAQSQDLRRGFSHSQVEQFRTAATFPQNKLLTPKLVPGPSGAPIFSFSPEKVIAVGLNEELAALSEKILSMSLRPGIDSGLFHVVVQHIDYGNSMWIWAVPFRHVSRMGDFCDLMDTYTVLLNNASNTLPPLTLPPNEYDLVVAPFNGSYYRAAVLQVAANGDCEVLYVDYGNRQIVPFTELYSASTLPALAGQNFPPVAIHCKLAGFNYGFRPRNSEIFLTELNKLMSYGTSAEEMLVGSAAENSCRPEIFLIHLQISRCGDFLEDLGAYLLSLGTSPKELRLNSRRGQNILHSGQTIHNVKVRDFESWDIVHIWPEDAAVAREKVKLLSRMMAQAFEESAISQPEVGSLVAVKHPTGLCYRGFVLEVHYGEQAVVRFLDFGREALGIYPFRLLSPLTENVLNFPPLILKCRVDWFVDNWQTRVQPKADQQLPPAAMGGHSVIVDEFHKMGEPDGDGDGNRFFSGAGVCLEDTADIRMMLPEGVKYERVGKQAVAHPNSTKTSEVKEEIVDTEEHQSTV